MDAPKIQIAQLLSETTKDCDNIVITVLCLDVTKKIPGENGIGQKNINYSNI